MQESKMIFLPPDSFSTHLFLFVLGSVLLAFFIGVYMACKNLNKKAGLLTLAVIIGTLSWLFIFATIIQGGFIKNHLMPGVPIFFVAINLLSLLVALSPVGGWLSRGISVSALVGFQVFRIPLEFVLHSWAEQGSIPESMTWNGQNWDVFSGFMALAFMMIVRRYPKLAWIPNIIGFGLLLNVMRVAVMSSPIPFAWTVNPPLQLALYLPYAFIVPIAVSGALIGHIVLTRALLARQK
jgi:hypothetical protein